MKNTLIGAAALLAGTAVLAQTPPPAPVAPPQAPVPTIHPVPTKSFTRAESVALVREHFGRLDANKDGVITTAEIESKHFEGGQRTSIRERSDPNSAFDRMDADRNGTISREEFARAREERVERRIERRQMRQEGVEDGRGARKQVRIMHGGRGFGARMIVMADSDKDGRITLAEAEALAMQHFDRLDANKDGQVTPEERRAGRPMIMKKSIEEKKTSG